MLPRRRLSNSFIEFRGCSRHPDADCRARGCVHAKRTRAIARDLPARGPCFSSQLRGSLEMLLNVLWTQCHAEIKSGFQRARQASAASFAPVTIHTGKTATAWLQEPDNCLRDESGTVARHQPGPACRPGVSAAAAAAAWKCGTWRRRPGGHCAAGTRHGHERRQRQSGAQ